MPKFEIIETCNEIRVYSYVVKADSLDAAREIFQSNKYDGYIEENVKDCLSSKIDIVELEDAKR
jgi:hypothetical protein